MLLVRTIGLRCGNKVLFSETLDGTRRQLQNHRKDHLAESDTTGKILVADDDPLLAASAGEILRRVGYVVAVEYNGIDAVNSARFFKPRVLLADIVMPGLNGVEAAIRIRGFFLHVASCSIPVWRKGYGFGKRPVPAGSPSKCFQSQHHLR